MTARLTPRTRLLQNASRFYVKVLLYNSFETNLIWRMPMANLLCDCDKCRWAITAPIEEEVRKRREKSGK
jgi:hypothetical protein